MLASVVLLTFNDTRYVASAMRSAFAQTYRPLEIVVSNDAGSDEAWRIVESVARECPSDIRLVLNRNGVNRGIAAHLCLAVEVATGDVIVAFAEDDISLPERVAATMRAFDDDTVAAVAGGQTLIDDAGNEIGRAPLPTEQNVETLARSGHAASSGAAAAYRRSVFAMFAPIGDGIVQEDVILFFRAALLGRIAVVPERLVHYRQHGDSMTGSTGPQAGSADVFARQTRRYVESIVRVRQQQIADATAKNAAAAVLRDLRRRMREETMCRDLIQRNPRALLRLGAAFSMPPREAIKAIAMHAAPRLWYRWISRHQTSPIACMNASQRS